jgi:prepilin-type N-terminal cleavage/methylation domain-containing protein
MITHATENIAKFNFHRPHNKLPSAVSRFGNQSGFTFIELILVIVMIGILSSVAAQRMMQVAEDAELSAEDSTIDVMRANLYNNFGEQLAKKQAAIFPQNPFTNLSKVPEGYDRRRNDIPTGNVTDSGLWTFVTGGVSSAFTPEQAGNTLTTFQSAGFIYHQRRDGTVVQWAYDSGQGVISNKNVLRPSDLKRRLDAQRQLRGELTEQDQLLRSQRQPGGSSGY